MFGRRLAAWHEPCERALHPCRGIACGDGNQSCKHKMLLHFFNPALSLSFVLRPGAAVHDRELTQRLKLMVVGANNCGTPVNGFVDRRARSSPVACE